MPNTRNSIFLLIMLSALVLVLFATGAIPVIVQVGTTIIQAIGSFFMNLIGR
jgi:hypothetical protein